jgi:hypothetical protein
MTMSKKSTPEKIGAVGKRKHMAGIDSKIKMMRNASRAAHKAAYKIALRGK